jgi:hypothetical protein
LPSTVRGALRAGINASSIVSPPEFSSAGSMRQRRSFG